MLFLHFPAIDDEDDVVDRDGCFGDIGREDDFLDPGWRSLEDELLLMSPERTVQRQNAKPFLIAKKAVACCMEN